MPIIYSFTIYVTSGKQGQCENDLRDVDHHMVILQEYNEHSDVALKTALMKYIDEHKAYISGFLNCLTSVSMNQGDHQEIYDRINADYNEKFSEEYDFDSHVGDNWVANNKFDLLKLYYYLAKNDNFRWLAYDYICV